MKKIEERFEEIRDYSFYSFPADVIPHTVGGRYRDKDGALINIQGRAENIESWARELLKQETTEVNEAVKKLANIIDFQIVSQEDRQTATALIAAKNEQDRQLYIRSLEKRIKELEKEKV